MNSSIYIHLFAIGEEVIDDDGPRRVKLQASRVGEETIGIDLRFLDAFRVRVCLNAQDVGLERVSSDRGAVGRVFAPRNADPQAIAQEGVALDQHGRILRLIDRL